MKHIPILFLLFGLNFSPSYSQVKVEADEFGDYNEGLAPIRKNTKWGFIDTTGKLIVPFKNITSHIQENHYPAYYEGICLIVDGSFYKYMDTSGNIISDNFFDEANHFSNGVAVVSEGGNIWYIVDENCQNKWDVKFYGLVDFKDNFSFGKDYSLELLYPWHLINKDGLKVSDKKFYNPSSFSEGLAVVGKKNEFDEIKYGYIDTTGKEVIDFIYSNKPGSFNSNMALVKDKAGKYGYINKSGRLVIDTQYEFGYDFKNGYAVVKTSKYSDYVVIDTLGDIVLDLKEYSYASISDNGLVLVSDLYEKKGFVNINEDIIIPVIYKELRNFNNGLAYAKLELKDESIKEGYINKNNEFVIVKNVSKF